MMVNPDVFLIVRAMQFVLALLYHDSLYTWLDECVRNFMRALERSFSVTHGFMLPPDVPLGEILRKSPKPMKFSAIRMKEAVFLDGSRGMRPYNTYKP